MCTGRHVPLDLGRPKNVFIYFTFLFFHVQDYRESTLIANENTGAVKVPFFDFGEIVDTKLRSQAEIRILYHDYI